MRTDWIEVGYKELVEKVSTVKNKLKQKDYSDSGKFPVVDQGKELIGGYTDSEDLVLNCNLPVIVFGDHTKAVKLINFRFVPGADGTKVLIPKPSINPTFLAFNTKILTQKIEDKGYARHYQQVENKTLFLPPLPEQRAIVARIEELFCELDHAVSSLQSAQAKLDIYRQAVLKKAFEGGFTEDWRGEIKLTSGDYLIAIVEKAKTSRFETELKEWQAETRLWNLSDKKGPKPIKPTQPKSINKLGPGDLSDLPEIPSGWKWVKNNELLYYVTSGSRDWKQFYSEETGVYFIRTQDINTNKLNLENAAFVNLPSNVEGKRSLVEKGDLLMTITGANVGKVAAIDFDIPEAYVSQSVALMKYVLPEMAAFLHYYFQASSAGAKYVGAMVYGVGRPVLSLENIREAPVPLCSLEEQNQIVQEIESRLSVADKMSETIQTSLQKAEALRQSILKKAFEGRLLSEAEVEACRKEADWEPAERLLERIKQKERRV